MQRIVVLLIFSLMGCKAKSQAVNWEKTTNWYAYAIQNTNAIQAPVDTLYQLPKLAITKEEVLPFLKGSQPVNYKEPPAWNGAYLISYEYPAGKINKLFIHPNGSFFQDQETSQYYELQETHRTAWREMIVSKIRRIKAG